MRDSESDGPIVLFDGACNFCDASVNWIIQHDKRARFRFAPLQSGPGAELQQKHGLDPTKLDTLILVEGGKVYRKSTAALRIAGLVDGPWRLLYALAVVPRPLRDAAYDWFARHRYRWFGRRGGCVYPRPGHRERCPALDQPGTCQD